MFFCLIESPVNFEIYLEIQYILRNVIFSLNSLLNTSELLTFSIFGFFCDSRSLKKLIKSSFNRAPQFPRVPSNSRINTAHVGHCR